MLSQQFMDVLAEFGATVGQNLTLDEDGITTFTIDDEIIVNLQYLEASDTIVAFTPVGAFGGTGCPSGYMLNVPPQRVGSERTSALAHSGSWAKSAVEQTTAHITETKRLIGPPRLPPTGLHSLEREG